MASLNDFISALRGAPTTGAQLNKDEAKLIAERQRVANARVHIEDVIAKGVNGTRKAAADSVSALLRHHLNADSMAATHADTIDNDEVVFNLLALTPNAPYPANAGDPKGTASIFPQGGSSVNAGLLTHLLLPQIETAVEQLIRDNLTEACRGGMRLSERRKRLADIDAKLAAIRAQRAELVEGLREAARHVAGAPEALAKGPTDAAVAAEAAEYEREFGPIVGAG
jgi:hypothetical protein